MTVHVAGYLDGVLALLSHGGEAFEAQLDIIGNFVRRSLSLTPKASRMTWMHAHSVATLASTATVGTKIHTFTRFMTEYAPDGAAMGGIVDAGTDAAATTN